MAATDPVKTAVPVKTVLTENQKEENLRKKIISELNEEKQLKALTVKALELGYYGHCRRRTGDIFVIAKLEDFSKKWMEKVSGDWIGAKKFADKRAAAKE